MTERAILLSIAPEFAEKIATGSKTIELRRRFPDVPTGTWVYLYVTLPVGAVLGRARVSKIEIDEPSKLWKRHRSRVGLTRNRFDEYFSTQELGFAIHLAEYETLAPLGLNELRRALHGFVAPQSYRFLDSAAQKVLLANSRPSRSTSSKAG